MSPLVRAGAAVLTGTSTAIVLVALAVLLFLNPVWVGFAQERAEAPAWTGFTPVELRTVTDAILADLVLGPPDFDVAIDGQPVLNAREIGHMQDVRGVFAAFFAVAGVAAVLLVVLRWRTRDRATFWRRVGAGGFALAVGTIVVGGLGLAFFDAAFTLFHRLFFAEGSWTFDPRTERLVQLFPYRFWIETTIALGAVLVVAGASLGWWARRREPGSEPGPASRPEPRPTGGQA